MERRNKISIDIIGIIFILLLGIIIFNGSCDQNINTPKEGNMQEINISIRPIKEEFELNTPILIEVIFENKSNKPLFLNEIFNVFQCELQFNITMPSGEKPHETFMAAGKMKPLNKKDFIKIPKGNAFRKIVNISERWYKLDQRGEYLISATYSNNKSWDELGIRAWTGFVKSKTVAFIIK